MVTKIGFTIALTMLLIAPRIAAAESSECVGDVATATPDELDRIILDCSEFLAGAHFKRGTLHSDKGEHDKAIADYGRFIELDPSASALGYYNRGNAYSAKGDHDRAIADYTKTIELNPEYSPAYNNRGTSYQRQQDLDRAIGDFTKAVELDPKNASAYLNRGIAYADKDEYGRGIADLEKALSIDPNLEGAKWALEELQSVYDEPSTPANGAASVQDDNTAPASAGSDEAEELAFWDSVKDSGDAAMLQAYIDQYPNGVFNSLANIKLKKLR